MASGLNTAMGWTRWTKWTHDGSDRHPSVCPLEEVEIGLLDVACQRSAPVIWPAAPISERPSGPTRTRAVEPAGVQARSRRTGIDVLLDDVFGRFDLERRGGETTAHLAS